MFSVDCSARLSVLWQFIDWNVSRVKWPVAWRVAR